MPWERNTNGCNFPQCHESGIRTDSTRLGIFWNFDPGFDTLRGVSGKNTNNKSCSHWKTLSIHTITRKCEKIASKSAPNDPITALIRIFFTLNEKLWFFSYFSSGCRPQWPQFLISNFRLPSPIWPHCDFFQIWWWPPHTIKKIEVSNGEEKKMI